MDTDGFDDEILAIAIDRKGVLQALLDGPYHRKELQTEFDLSKTTCHRIIRTFDDHDLIRRTESGYRLTLLGQIVAREVTQFEETVATASRLDPLLEQIESSNVDFDHTVFTDADWRVEQDRSSLDRGVQRVRDATVLRVLDWTAVPELYIERIFRIMADQEIRSEAIYPKAAIAKRLERFPDLHEELMASGAGHRYWVSEDVPQWGMTIYDDALVELRAYERETGAHMLDATSEDPGAVQWATAVFEQYRDRADPLTEFSDLPDWGDYSW